MEKLEVGMEVITKVAQYGNKLGKNQKDDKLIYIFPESKFKIKEINYLGVTITDTGGGVVIIPSGQFKLTFKVK